MVLLGRMLAAKNTLSLSLSRYVSAGNGFRRLATLAQAQVAKPPEELDDAGVKMVVEALKAKPQGEALKGAMQHWDGSVGQKTVNKVMEQLKDGGTALGFFDWAARQEAFSKHSIHSYRLLLRKLAVSGMAKEARRVLGEMHRAGCYLKKQEYVFIVSELLKGNHPEEVVGIVEDMISKMAGFNPSVANQIIRASFEQKKQDVAAVILKLLLCRSDGSSGEDASGWTLESLLKQEGDHTMAMDLLCREGLMPQACSVFDRMLIAGHEPGLYVYVRLADGFVRVSKLPEAMALLDVMAERGVIPRAIVYNQLIDGLCKAGRVNDAFELSAAMLRNGCSPTLYTYNSLINGLCLQGKTGEAREFMYKMADAGRAPDVVTYTMLISRLRKDGNYKAAVEVFDEMVSKGCVPDKPSYLPLLVDLCRVGCIRLAQNLVDRHKSRLDLGSFFYNLLIRTHGKLGRVDEARKVFSEMPSPELVHFNSFMSALCQRKLISEAFQVYESIQKNGLVPDTYTYTILIGGLCDVGRIDEALALKETMIQNRITPDKVTYGVLRAGLARAGRGAEAEKLEEPAAAAAAGAGAGAASL